MAKIPHWNCFLLPAMLAFTTAFSTAWARQGPVPKGNFGEVIAALRLRHPPLGPTTWPKEKSFYFSFAFGSKPLPAESWSRAMVPAGHRASVPYPRAWVVGRGKAAAVLMFLPGGPCVYWTTNGAKEFIAVATPSEPREIFTGTHRVSAVAYGLVTPAQRAAVGLARRVRSASLKGDIGFFVGHRRTPEVFLRLLAAIRAKLKIAEALEFKSGPVPILAFGWTPHPGGFESMRVAFDLKRGALFPVRSLQLAKTKAVGPPSYARFNIGSGRLPGGVVIHRPVGAARRSGLPCVTGKVGLAVLRYATRQESRGKPRRRRELSPAYLALRKRLINWATTPRLNRRNPAPRSK